MAERSNNLRKYILKELENGNLSDLDKLPSARVLAQMHNMTLSIAQSVLNSLMQDGVIMAKARNGSYVQKNWRQRVISDSFSYISQELSYKCIGEILGREIPDLYITTQMPKATFEVQVSYQVLCSHNDYMDLMPIFNELFGEGNEFFKELLQPFIIDGKLCGIPIAFSPRLLIFNKKLLEKYNAPIPQENWSWDDFLNLIVYLKDYLPGEQIFSWINGIHQWINIVTRSNGMLFANDQEDNVKVDDPNTVAGLLKHAELRNLLDIDTQNPPTPQERRAAFANGEVAMIITALPFLNQIFVNDRNLNDFSAVAIPTPQGGNDYSVMAADLICVRESCSDIDMAKNIIKILLSSEVQHLFAKTNYSIPFLKEEALNNFQNNNHLTMRFMNEISKLYSNYNIYSPELYQLVCNGIEDIMLLPTSQVPHAIEQLAAAVRVFLKYSPKKNRKRDYYVH